MAIIRTRKHIYEEEEQSIEWKKGNLRIGFKKLFSTERKNKLSD